MHDILANYRVGSLTMKVCDMELKKAELREEERRTKQQGEVRRRRRRSIWSRIPSS